MNQAVDTLRCSTCKEVKLVSEFSRNKTAKSGFQNACKSCMKEYKASWDTRNPGRQLELQKDWYRRNPEHQHALQRDWYEKNKEKHCEDGQAWAVANRPLKAHYARTRRGREWAAKGFANPEQVTARVDYFNNCCSYCGGPYEELDHSIPLASGGTNWPSNLRPACVPCNRKKSTKTIWEFLGIERRAA